MTMTPAIRKLALTTHVTTSVGWLGAVAGFLALAIAGVTSGDEQTVRASYIAMDLVAWFVIVPLSLASPLSGVIQSLGTPWGLFKHYWVVAKLVMTIPASLILLLHMEGIGQIAGAASRAVLANGEMGDLRGKLIVNTVAALVVLLATTTLSVYKPQGATGFGGGAVVSREAQRWRRAFAFVIGAAVILFIIRHVMVGGMDAHGP